MKKLLAAVLTAILVLAPVGNFVFQESATTVDAKSYKSGKKSFNTDRNSNIQNNNINKSDTTTTNKAKTNTTNKGGFMSGGLMKGLMLGGLAGLLFGSLFANMGVLGSILGFLINVIAIVAIIVIIRKIFVYFKDKKKKEDTNPWRN